MENEKREVTFFGHKIGTHGGWDMVDDFHIVAYDFEPYAGFDMPVHDLNIDYTSGKFQNYDTENGDLLLEKDILTVMNDFLKKGGNNAL